MFKFPIKGHLADILGQGINTCENMYLKIKAIQMNPQLEFRDSL